MSPSLSLRFELWEGRPVEAWRRDWAVPLLEIHPSLGSTNDRARALVAAGAPSLSVVIAEEQTAGRGRGGRSWASPPGLGLWMSVVLRPEDADARPFLSVAVGAAVARAIEPLVAPAVPGLKWPNDVLVGGRKVCGILCEAAGTPAAPPVIVGIGINVRQGRDDFAPELQETATSLLLATGRVLDRGSIAGRILALVGAWLVPAPRRLEGEVAREVARFDLLYGREIVASQGLCGRGAGIAPDGALLVTDEKGARRRVLAGSVTLTDKVREREGAA